MTRPNLLLPGDPVGAVRLRAGTASALVVGYHRSLIPAYIHDQDILGGLCEVLVSTGL